MNNKEKDNMNNKEKDIVSLFNELMSMFNELLSENIELKKLIKRYRNDPNAKFEPTEEELNSLFMDKQVDPDEQDMYLNPEKHTGGDKTKKDIEFEAEKLVKSVKDYADSIQNKNESDFKYFCASTGKWNDIELMKQDPEILALKDTKPKLKSLKQHNDSKLTNVFGVNSKNSGFACPICTSELIYTNPNLMLTSHPPKQEVRCSNCNHIDYVY
jgi:hypothetical protein